MHIKIVRKGRAITKAMACSILSHNKFGFIQGAAEILKHFEILIAYNATRGCKYT
jgi:hypothetical protein